MLKKLFKKLIYKERCDSETYIKYLKKIGIKIGVETKIYSPRNIIIDEQKPWLIDIGNNVQITDGVRILTHGYDWSTIKVKTGKVLGSSGKIRIGNNVFIGVNTTILKGVTIGDNIIIGANSLVNKNCIEEGVYAGNPARYIMSLDEYTKKRESKQLEEAYELITEYYKRFKKWPDKNVLREFFWLFEEKENVQSNSVFNEVMELEGNGNLSYSVYDRYERKFKNFEEFMLYVKERFGNDCKDNK